MREAKRRDGIIDKGWDKKLVATSPKVTPLPPERMSRITAKAVRMGTKRKIIRYHLPLILLKSMMRVQ